jgi:stage III sporulation protein AB
MKLLIKTLGLILLFCSCALCGVGQSAILCNRVDSLERIIAMLGALGEELSYNQTPLRTAAERLSRRSAGAARDFLHAACTYMEAGLPPPESWARAAEELRAFEKTDRQELASLAYFLGGSDIEGQRATIGRCLRALEERRHYAVEKRDRLSKVYRTLGVLAGMAAVVAAL